MIRKLKPTGGTKRTARKAKPRVADSTGFWQPKTVEALAAEQGVHPIDDPKQLRGEFWPQEESMDEFLAWLRKLRQK